MQIPREKQKQKQLIKDQEQLSVSKIHKKKKIEKMYSHNYK